MESLKTEFLQSGNDDLVMGMHATGQGILNSLLVKKLRASVTAIMRDRHGEEFANLNYGGMVQMIINCHLAMTFPIWKQAATAEQIEKVKKDFPLQLQMLESISKLIKEGKNIKQIQYTLGFF